MKVQIQSAVISVLMNYRQIDGRGKEAGGQLFARFYDGMTIVEMAGQPKKSDRRWWNGFIPCRTSERREIGQMYASGLHFVGDWHTHPESTPHYSEMDLLSTRECFLSSKHSLTGLLMTIVGYAEDPREAIRVWYISQESCVNLELTDQE